MGPINCHIANASGKLSQWQKLIESSFAQAVSIITDDFEAGAIDVVFRTGSDRVIPELGVGGFASGPNHIDVFIDPESEKASGDNLLATLLHELHHCIRWRNPGYGKSLGEHLVFEGLACLYELERLGRAPIYTNTNLDDKRLAEARQAFDRTDYDQGRWFFGSEDVECWFGYSLGYQLCRDYSKSTGQSAVQLVDVAAADILAESRN